MINAIEEFGVARNSVRHDTGELVRPERRAVQIRAAQRPKAVTDSLYRTGRSPEHMMPWPKPLRHTRHAMRYVTTRTGV